MIAELSNLKTTMTYGSTIEAVVYGLADSGVSVVTGACVFVVLRVVAFMLVASVG